MHRVQHPPSDDQTRNAEFIDAVIHANEDAVRWALESGADVNATDAAGRSSVACAITGESWTDVDASDASFMNKSRLNILHLLVSHQHVSLYSLNAPQEAMNGVTPLGIASWLNAVDAVRILLESSSGAVAVNGTDAHGATPLMYAARDGSLDVVQPILSVGGRPDFRDRHHRTSIQYALGHSQVLWLCEEALRKHRADECQSGNERQLCSAAYADIDRLLITEDKHSSVDVHALPPAHLFSPSHVLTNTSNLVKCIISADLPLLRSLLFLPSLDTSEAASATATPVLVNMPDSQDWSPIHYCVSVRLPSIEVVDILYRAGADVSLFSRTGNCTPLHCLARRKRGPDSFRGPEATKLLYQFVVHLVRDLGAPLAALDHNRDTCIHIAAEHGDSAEVLRAFLDCDPDGTVREMRNSRGLTALEIAKPEFRSVFGVLDEHLRPDSSASLLTVRPLHSYSSIPSLASVASDMTSMQQCSSPVSPMAPVPSPTDDPMSPTRRLLRNLHFITHELYSAPQSAVSDLDRLQTVLRQTTALSTNVVSQLRSRIDEVRDGLHDVQDDWTKVDSLLDAVAQAVEEKLRKESASAGKRSSGEPHGRSRSDTTVSADSDITAVDLDSEDAQTPVIKDGHAEVTDNGSEQPGSTSNVLDLPEPRNGEIHDDLLASWPPWLDPFEAKYASQNNPHGDSNSGSVSASATHQSRLKASKSMSDLRRSSSSSGLKPPSSGSPPPRRPRADTSVGVLRRPAIQSGNGKESEIRGTARLKAWFKRKILPERPVKAPPAAASARVSTEPRSSLTTLCEQEEHANGSSSKTDAEQKERQTLFPYRALTAAGKDLARIDQSVTDAGHAIGTAYRALVQAEQIIKKALKTRETLIQEHRSAHSLDAGLAAVLAWDTSIVATVESPPSPPQSLRSRTNSSASIESSAASSALGSFASISDSTSDEHDIRVLHRLLTRKVEDKVDDAFAEVDKVETWLKVIRGVLGDIEARTGVQV
ncbi:ankyrin [Dentipellis sp. KUC8613]|nr:ankyrin [Dentipellis sp. KUC8613]